MIAMINRILDWFKSLFWKEEMELTLVGLQYSGKTTFVNVIAVSATATMEIFSNKTRSLQRWMVWVWCGGSRKGGNGPRPILGVCSFDKGRIQFFATVSRFWKSDKQTVTMLSIIEKKQPIIVQPTPAHLSGCHQIWFIKKILLCNHFFLFTF